MAAKQAERHELGRNGEQVAAQLLGGQTTNHKAPFDLVDFAAGYAYEVKTMAALGKDNKIHITDTSMARKRAWARKYGLKMVLLAVVIYGPDKVEVYQSKLKQSIRVNQMKLVERREQ